jgi:uracil-DNA glycosylase
MSERIPAALQDKISKRLAFYREIGIDLFYRDRYPAANPSAPEPVTDTPAQSVSPLPKSPSNLAPAKFAPAKPAPTVKSDFLPRAPGVSLFDAANRVAGDSLPVIQAELVDCTRCKLHRGRTTIVFGDGNPKAQLMFVGEGPGRDEDIQGLPFVGRAGKLLTQMIEAMGLQRKDVYIANVVKCRPPENRTPERDEVATCSPYLLRQIDAIDPQVIVCLGSVAAQTLLETNRGITHYRGQWLDLRGKKLLATYHPAYLLRNPSAKGEVWKDLQKVMAELGLQLRKGKSAGPGQSP